jgi:uncharacterized protein (DUF952 family)
METLLHIAHRADWEAVAETGEYRPASLEAEGFIHLSTAAQIVETANRFFRGQPDLLLLRIAPERLSAPLRWEDLYGHGSFPHLYGPLDCDAVTTVLPLKPEADGTFTLPKEWNIAG